jgi:hypothetical protein
MFLVLDAIIYIVEVVAVVRLMQAYQYLLKRLKV